MDALTSDIVVRDARPDELEGIYLLGLDRFQVREGWDWGWYLPFLALCLEMSFGFVHVAVRQEQLVGFHVGVWNYPESNTEQCRWYWLYIIPDARRMGVGTLLMEAALVQARNLGKKSICIGVWDDNDASRSTVESFGLTPVARMTIYRREI
jgi:GNAT superfamily N-acetyltransferase